MDYNKLNPQKDIIIPRAMYVTTSDSFKENILRLKRLYSKDDILNYIKTPKNLSVTKYVP